MKTKILDTENDAQNDDGKTQIIENSSTVIIEEAQNNEGGTQIISEENSATVGTAETQNSAENVKHLSGAPISKDCVVDIWKIKSQMETNSGEADLFLCEKANTTFVFKYYRNFHKPKIEVVEKIKNLKSSHIVKLLDYGFYNERFFEVYEYVKFGSINTRKKDGSYKYLPISEDKIFAACRDIVETFTEFHQAGIIHRDIKPDNFMLRSVEPLDIVIGDFGIASVMDEGEELHKTKTEHHTTGYVPREFFTADYEGIGTGIDYYALGITLWEFATGGMPFVNNETGKMRNENHILRDTFEGRIADDLLSQKYDLSQKMKSLIRGLLVTDYKKRWGYSEVIRHLNGEKVDIAEVEIKKIKVSILGKTYDDEKDLALALWNNKDEISWNMLSKISEALNEIHSYIAESVQNVVQDITDKDNLEIPILKILYLLNPDNSFDIGNDYAVSNKDDVVNCLTNAPETIESALENTDSVRFTYISMILGGALTKKITDMLNEEKQRNQIYYNMSDNMYPLKIVTKTKLIIENRPIKPFKSDDYKNIAFYDLSDLNNLNEEQHRILLERVSKNIYEGNFVPWLELKSGVRREEMNTDSWDDFMKTIKGKETFRT